MQLPLSKLYIDEQGYLMLGEPNRFSSAVEATQLIPYNIENGKEFDYEIIFIDGDGNPCNGYSERYCEEKYR